MLKLIYGEKFLRMSASLILFMLCLSIGAVEESADKMDSDPGKIIADLDDINYDIAERVNDFLEKNPKKRREIIYCLGKFTNDVEEMKKLLAEP